MQRTTGEWECRHGIHIYDTHHNLHDALRHLRSLRHDLTGDTILRVHYLDGTVVTA